MTLTSNTSESTSPDTNPPIPTTSALGFTTRRRWIVIACVALGASVYRAGIGSDVINTRGWSNFAAFWTGIGRLRLDAEYLFLVWDETLTTLSFAILGTIMSVILGLFFGPILSERVWSAESALSPIRQRLRAGARQFVTLGGVLPRAMHEVIWALLLAQVYGTAPLVAVIAIGVPFGATTAAVFADTLDEANGTSFYQLRANGVGRLSALLYGLLPHVRGDLVSYGFYRFECSVRSAAILGIIGAGGLGYQIDLSFQTLKYGEMWTMIAALVALSWCADTVSSMVRRRSANRNRCGDVRVPTADRVTNHEKRTPRLIPSRVPTHAREINENVVSDVDNRRHATSARRRTLGSFALVSLVAIGAWKQIEMDITLLWEPRRRQLMSRLITEMFPPRLPPGGWSALIEPSIDTVAMAILAIAISSVAAFFFALIGTRQRVGVARGGHLVSRVLISARGIVVRLFMLIGRAVPPPVWAFLAALILFPGTWPGVAALAAYNTGVLSRLYAESFEDLDIVPTEALAAIGARRTAQLWYGAVPLVASRFVALSIYRWEVLTRETVIVGVVGAAGLGRLIQNEFVSRDFAAVTSSMIALAAIILAAGVAGRAMRKGLN